MNKNEYLQLLGELFNSIKESVKVDNDTALTVAKELVHEIAEDARHYGSITPSHINPPIPQRITPALQPIPQPPMSDAEAMDPNNKRYNDVVGMDFIKRNITQHK